jgi:hypothetical protein
MEAPRRRCKPRWPSCGPKAVPPYWMGSTQISKAGRNARKVLLVISDGGRIAVDTRRQRLRMRLLKPASASTCEFATCSSGTHQRHAGATFSLEQGAALLKRGLPPPCVSPAGHSHGDGLDLACGPLALACQSFREPQADLYPMRAAGAPHPRRLRAQGTTCLAVSLRLRWWWSCTGSAAPNAVSRRSVVDTHGRRRGAGCRICDLHGAFRANSSQTAMNPPHLPGESFVYTRKICNL